MNFQKKIEKQCGDGNADDADDTGLRGFFFVL